MKKASILLTLTLLLSMALSAIAGAAYVVKPGDVLWKIAKDNGTTVKELVALNGLKDANKIITGQSLKLPGEGATTTTPAAPQPIQPAAELNFPDQILPTTGKGNVDSISAASGVYYKAGTLAAEDLVRFAKEEVSFPMVSTVNSDGTPNAAIFGSGLTDDLKYVTFGMAPNTTLANMKAGSMGVVTFFRYIHNEPEKFIRNRGFRVVVEFNEADQGTAATTYGAEKVYCKVLKFMPLG